jgi:ubiquinone/menaquinone biosynthesis C-methylase UbiE
MLHALASTAFASHGLENMRFARLISNNVVLEHGKVEMEYLPKGLVSSGAIEISKKLRSVSGGRILDVATAGGGFIDTLMKTLKDYDSFVGIDYCASATSKKEMESAKKRFEGKPVQFLEMNAENLDFEDGSFDTVCISHSLHHLSKIDRVLTEMKRVLKRGGNFILQEAYCDGDQTEAQKADELEHEWEAKIDSLLGITHNRSFSKQRIMYIVSSLKLRELEVFDSTHPIDCLFCERKHECEDPKNQATFHKMTKEIDDAIRRIENYPDLETRNRLKEEGERIKETIAKSGSASASCLFAIGKTQAVSSHTNSE